MRIVASDRPQPPLFALGDVEVTSDASEALKRADQTSEVLLGRYITGDWGNINEKDRRLNEIALVEGNAIFGSFETRLGEAIWIISEADRSVTTVMLPSEF